MIMLACVAGVRKGRGRELGREATQAMIMFLYRIPLTLHSGQRCQFSFLYAMQINQSITQTWPFLCRLKVVLRRMGCFSSWELRISIYLALKSS